MSETDIFQAARASVAASLPMAKDWSDNPADVKPERKGLNSNDPFSVYAFVVALTRDGAKVAAMGSSKEDVQLTLEVEVFTAFKPDQDGRSLTGAIGVDVRSAILSSPPLIALCDFITAATFDVDLAAAEDRMGRVTISLSIEATI